MSDGKQQRYGEGSPKFLNNQSFLCWRCSSSQTKACKFLGTHPAPEAVALPRSDLLLPICPASADAPCCPGLAALSETLPALRSDRRVPIPVSVMAVYLKSPSCLPVAQLFFPHRFHYILLKLRRISGIPVGMITPPKFFQYTMLSSFRGAVHNRELLCTN